jgi:hypothetical protein
VQVSAYYVVRNPRRTWTGSPPDPAAGETDRPPDLEVAELHPLASVPEEDATAALLFAGGAMLYLENAAAEDELRDGQIVALRLQLDLDVAPIEGTPKASGPRSAGGQAGRRGRAG